MLRNYRKGQSILGVIMAMAIFALMVSAIAGTSVGNISALNQGNSESRAEALAQEAVESIRAIKDEAWNNLYSSSTISFGDYSWSFDSTNIQIIGDYTRTVTFSDVCRNDTSHDVEDCATGTLDLQSKKVNVTVSWEVRPGLTNSVVKEFYLTNWDSREWTQTDWSSGPGQTVLSDTAAYDSDDGNLDYSTAGELKIAEQGGGVCTNTTWIFDQPTDYVYDDTKIEVSNNTAHLLKDNTVSVNGLADSLMTTVEAGGSSSVYAPIHITGDIYAIYYYDSVSPYNGHLKTYILDSSGGVSLGSDLSLGVYASNLTIKNVYGNVYAAFYTAKDGSYYNVLYMQTFSVDSSTGAITSITSEYKYNGDVYNIYNFQVEKIEQGVYGVFFTGDIVAGTGINYGNLRIVNIDNSGNVTNPDTVIQYGNGSGYSVDEQKILSMDNGRYFLLYSETDQSVWTSQVYSKVVDINSGNITETATSTMSGMTSGLYNVSLVKKSSTTVMLMNNSSGSAGVTNGELYVRTINVAVDGTMSDIDSLTVSSDYTYFNTPKLYNITGDIYAVIFGGTLYNSSWTTLASGGYLNTFSVDSSGNISDTALDSYTVAASNVLLTTTYSLSNVYQDVYLLSYQSSTGLTDYTYQGYMSTMSIDAYGNITSTGSSLNYNSSATNYAVVVHGFDSYYTVLYYKSSTGQVEADLFTVSNSGTISSVIDSYVDTISNFYTLEGAVFGFNDATTFYYREYINSTYVLKFSVLGYGYSGQLYTTTKPNIKPAEAFTFSTEEQLNSFSETASKGTGEIYYQLSDDEGSSWKYWNGGYWVTAGSTDYNTADTVSANINKFATSTGSLMFRAFLESDGQSQVSLSSISLNCAQSYTWDFSLFDEYIYDPLIVQIVNGKAKLKLIDQSIYTHTWDFATTSVYVSGVGYVTELATGYEYNPLKVDLSNGDARLKYIEPTGDFDIDYNTTSSAYVYDSSKIEFLDGKASLKHIGPALGGIDSAPTDTANLGGVPAYASDIVQVRDGMYVYVYNLDNLSGGRRNVYLVTKNVSADGTTISANLGSYVLSVNSALQTSSDDFSEVGVVKVSDGVVAVAYSSGRDTYVTTLGVGVDGTFSNIGSYAFPYTYPLQTPLNADIIKVENATDTFLVGFMHLYGNTDTFYAKTINISSNGTIGSVLSNATIAQDEGTTSNPRVYRNPELMYMGNGIYLASYDRLIPGFGSYNGYSALSSFTVNSSGIISSVISTVMVDSIETNFLYNRNVAITKLSDNYFATVYTDINKNGWIKTFYINGSGGITYTPIDSFQYKTNADGSYPDIEPIGTDNYAIISNKHNDYGTIDTFNISSSGVINTTPIDSYTYETDDGDSGQLQNVGTGIYAIGSQISADSLALSTIAISSSGSITKSLISTYILGGGSIQKPDIIHVRDNIYVYAYADAGGTKSYITTRIIDNDGTITPAALDSFIIANAQYGVLKISDGVFALYYGNIVATYSVDASGIMTLIQTYTHSTSGITDLLKLENSSSNVYAVVSSQTYSYVYTITISDEGVIGSVIDSFSFMSPNSGYTSYSRYHLNTRIIYVNDNIYALSYDTKQDYPTYKSITEIITINIEGDGTIVQTNTSLDLINLDTKTGNVNGYVPDYNTTMVKVSGTYIAVSYTKTDGTTYLGTLNIDSSGLMPTSLNYSLTYGSGTAQKYQKIIHLVETVYALTYTLNNQMILDTYNIATDGVITSPKIDTLTYDSYGNGRSKIIQVDGNIFAIAHHSISGTAGLSTINILATPTYDTNKPTVVAYHDDFGVGNWLDFTETAVKNGGGLYYQLSPDGVSWYYWDTTSSNWSSVVNATSDYNLSSEINTNIGTFNTSTSKLYVKSFFVSNGVQKVSLDNINVNVDRITYGYATDRPYIMNTVDRALAGDNINTFDTFVADVTNSSGGDVYYQLSDDGLNWQYFDGSRWITATNNTQVNSASEVNQYLQMFDSVNKSLYFKAFFVTDGTQQVELNSLKIDTILEPVDEYTQVLLHMDETTGNLVNVIDGQYFYPSGSYAGVYDKPGKFGSSIYFNQSNKFANNNASLYNLSNRFTIDFWANLSSYSTGNWMVGKWSYYNGYSQGSYAVWRGSSTGQISFYLGSTSVVASTPSYTISAGKWQHIAVTYDGTYIRIYIDGVYKGGKYYPGYAGGSGSTFPLSLGSLYHYNGSYYGYLDEVRISNIARWTGTTSFTPPLMPSGDPEKYTAGTVSVESKLPYSFTSSLAFASFIESATKNNGEIYYQLSDDEGSTWKYWNGSAWSTAGSTDYNTATEVSNNIAEFPTSTGKVSLKTFFVSDGTQYMDIDSATINWTAGEGGGSGGGSGSGMYATSTYFISSAFDMGDNSPVQFLDWDEDLTQCTDCSVKVQVSTAPDNSGSPGTWTDWYGVGGAEDYFINYTGSIIPRYLNGHRWVRYRVELLGDGTSTPILQEMRINYK